MNERSASPEEEKLAELLQATAAGSKAAMGAVYDLTAPRVYAISRSVFGDGSAAEDAARAAFVAVWALAPRFRSGTDSAMTWVLTVSVRAIARQRR